MAILYEKRDNLAIITINRPEAMNALDPETSEELGKAWTDFRDDPNLWVAILTGAGEKAFSAGADLKKMIPFLAQLTSIQRKERDEKFPGLGGITRNFYVWKPIIAAIDGYCLAGGLEISLQCDIRIVTQKSTFGLPEPRRSLLAGYGLHNLSRMIPLGHALYIQLTGNHIDADTAARWGIVQEIVPDRDALMARVEQIADDIMQCAPLAVQAIKRIVMQGRNLPVEYSIKLAKPISEIIGKTEDRLEGPKAFAEKRKPVWKMR